jgi:hypothetical protein
MKLSFHPDAVLEFEAAIGYYEELQTGLGLEFAEEVCSTITRITEYPDAWSKLSSNTRRCIAHRFPYGIIYQAKQDVIRIIAVANLQRRPDYWKERGK